MPYLPLSLHRNIFLVEIRAQWVDFARIYDEITSASLHVSVALRFWLHFYVTRALWRLLALRQLPADPAAVYPLWHSASYFAPTPWCCCICNRPGCIIEGGWLTASLSECGRRFVVADFDLARSRRSVLMLRFSLCLIVFVVYRCHVYRVNTCVTLWFLWIGMEMKTCSPKWESKILLVVIKEASFLWYF
jgi:hypothetical protein